jgi:hypothetical protein
MTTKPLSLLDYPELGPAFGLWSRYDPRRRTAALIPVLIERVERPDHVREKWLLQTWKGG